MKDWKQELDGLGVGVLGQSEEVVARFVTSATRKFDRGVMQRGQAIEPARLTSPSRLQRSTDNETPLAWLCCRPLPPVPLVGTQTLVIGRAPECHVVLPHVEVSRRHATIEVGHRMARIEDHGSSNGVIINGRRVTVAALETGDVIMIGPYRLEVMTEDAARTWEAEDEGGDAVDAPEAEHAMSGRIDKVPLREVIQQIEFNKYTGTMQVSSGRKRGWLVIEEGKPRSAAFEKLRDGEALLAMLRLRDGRFTVVRTPDLGPRRMTESLTGILLEAARHEDESSSEAEADVGAGGEAPPCPIPDPVRAPRLSPNVRAGSSDRLMAQADPFEATPHNGTARPRNDDEARPSNGVRRGWPQRQDAANPCAGSGRLKPTRPPEPPRPPVLREPTRDALSRAEAVLCPPDAAALAAVVPGRAPSTSTTSNSSNSSNSSSSSATSTSSNAMPVPPAAPDGSSPAEPRTRARSSSIEEALASWDAAEPPAAPQLTKLDAAAAPALLTHGDGEIEPELDPCATLSLSPQQVRELFLQRAARPATAGVEAEATAPAPSAPSSGARFAWSLCAVLTVVSAALAGQSARAGGPAGPAVADLEVRACALEEEVVSALAASTALANDRQLAQLRGEAEALRALGVPAAMLERAEVALDALEGLAGAARGDVELARAAASRSTDPSPWPGAASALRGALAALQPDADARAGSDALTFAIQNGVGRPELRRWRARLMGRAGVSSDREATAVLEDLAAADAALEPDAGAMDDLLLRVRALRQLGRSAEARQLLDEARAHHGQSAWAVALGAVDHAMARGDPAEALRALSALDPGAFGPPPPAARQIGERALLEAAVAAASSAGERPSTQACERLLALLRLAQRLEVGPMPRAALEPLLRALDAPGPVDPSICLGLAEVGGPGPIRQRVLTRIYRALESQPAEHGMDMSILLVLVTDPASARRDLSCERSQLVEAARRSDVRADLYEARAIARSELGKLGEALRDVDRALALCPDRAEAKELKRKLEEAIRTGQTNLAPRRRVG